MVWFRTQRGSLVNGAHIVNIAVMPWHRGAEVVAGLDGGMETLVTIEHEDKVLAQSRAEMVVSELADAISRATIGVQDAVIDVPRVAKRVQRDGR